MLGFLKRVVHRGEDLNDIRSHVLGDKYSYEPEPFPQQQRPQTIKAQLALPEQQPYQQPYGQYENEAPLPEPGFESRYGESSAPLSSFNEPSQLGRSADKASRDYDILDRLNLMESQIAAIRSMTETINERLKNIDAKLSTRRY